MSENTKLKALTEKKALISGKLMILKSINLDPSKLQTKIKIDRRMKLYIKLDQDQTKVWTFMKQVFDTMSDDDLAKAIFLNGLLDTKRKMELEVEQIQKEIDTPIEGVSEVNTENLDTSKVPTNILSSVM